MLETNNKKYRNMQEQVQKNAQDIQDLKDGSTTIAEWGIHIKDEFATEQEFINYFAEHGTEDLEPGDAYLIGTEAPYDVRVWTEPESGEDHFVDLGLFPKEGPQGETGPRGETGPQGIQGEQGAKGNTGDTGAKGDKGDKGDQGVQGPAGPKGDKGDVGGFVKIAGIKATESDLPDPSTLGDLTLAYLVGNDFDLYIQVGTSSAEAQWLNTGPLNAATLVYKNGLYVNTWDSDTKVDKYTGTDTTPKAYVNMSGADSTISCSNAATGNTIPLRTNGGQVKVGNPTVDADAVNKGTMDTELAGKLDASKNAVSMVGGLVIPNSAPSEHVLVGIDLTNGQELIGLGTGFSIQNGKLTFAGGGGTQLYRHYLHWSSYTTKNVWVISTRAAAYTKATLQEDWQYNRNILAVYFSESSSPAAGGSLVYPVLALNIPQNTLFYWLTSGSADPAVTKVTSVFYSSSMQDTVTAI